MIMRLMDRWALRLTLAIWLVSLPTAWLNAAQITVLSAHGNWHDPTYTSNSSGIGNIVNGDPTSSINWGGTVAVSGYDFSKTLPGPQVLPPAPTPLFPLGTFTHRNKDLALNTGGFRSLQAVKLDVVLTLSVDGTTVGPLSFTFNFNHDETNNANTLSQCDPSKLNPTSTYPCPDVVTFTASPTPTTFKVGGVDYTLAMSFVDSQGKPIAKFITEELQDNVANLVGQFNTPAIGGGSNTPPTVNAGPDQTLNLPASTNLFGTASDDGLPNNILTVNWTKVSGPGSVSFGNAQSLATAADFASSGTYVLRLTASDTLLTASDDVTITVLAGSPPTAPAPILNSLTPNTTAAGSPAFNLTLNGAQFVNGATVLWNSVPRPTTFISSTQLRAAITAADVATVRTVSVFVANPDLQASGQLPFIVIPPTPTPFNLPVARIVVFPSSAAVAIGAQIAFNAIAYDANNAVIPGVLFNWSATGPNALSPVSGSTMTVFTGGTTPGVYMVTASSQGFTGQAVVAVQAGAVSGGLSLIDPATATPNPVPGTLTHLHVLATSTNPGPISYRWDFSGLAAVIQTPNAHDTDVTFTQPGIYQFNVVITDAQGLVVTSGVSVTVVRTVTRVVVSPPNAATMVGQAFPFTAAAFDQFNQPISASLMWSASAGSITGAGSFMASAAMQNITIAATATNGVSGTARMSVYGAGAGGGSMDLSQAKAYPVPYKSTSGVPGITFSGLTANTSIRIFTTDGHLVQTLHSDGSNVLWPVTNMKNEKVASWVYFYRIENGVADQVKEGKLVIIQ